MADEWTNDQAATDEVVDNAAAPVDGVEDDEDDAEEGVVGEAVEGDDAEEADEEAAA